MKPVLKADEGGVDDGRVLDVSYSDQELCGRVDNRLIRVLYRSVLDL